MELKGQAILCLAALALATPAQAAAPKARVAQPAPAAPARLGPPITITWNRSQTGCVWGSQIARHMEVATRDANRNTRRQSNQNVEIQGTAQVNRPWGRLTVTAVSIASEMQGVHFAQPLPVVLNELRAIGFAVKKSPDEGTGWYVEGNIQDGAYDTLNAANDRYERKLGLTTWWCGL